MRSAPALLLAITLTGCAGAQSEGMVSAVSGERVFRKCYACHSLEPGETGLSGPNLRGVVGRRIAAEEGFDYSPAMRAFAEREGRWTEALIGRFVTDPEVLVPGTDMFVPPVTDPAERAALMAYLKAN